MLLKGWKTVDAIDIADGKELPKVQVSVKLTAFYSQFDPLDAEGSREAVSGTFALCCAGRRN
jgi:RHH-type proline utilization regulon transcriptional repressor/proline dehydrogenase/delta 1-pyrroline-5-carboxylate dehydrogenase